MIKIYSKYDQNVKCNDVIFGISQKAIQGGLHGGRFPYVAQVEANRGNFTEPTETRTAHVRARDKDWDFGGGDAGVRMMMMILSFRICYSHCQPPTPRTSRVGANLQVLNLPDTGTPPLILFVLGGVTMSEMRSAYEVSRQLGCEIFIGEIDVIG